MNCRVSVKEYIQRMLDITGEGMKALLLDKLTTQIITQVYTMSQMAKNEVFLLETLETQNNHTPKNIYSGSSSHITALPYVKAILFVRPTQENINNLCSELQKPKFGKYYIFFTNVISRAEIKRIAESDRQELVEQVQQFYCDFLPIGGNEWMVPSKLKIIETTKSFSSEGLIRCRDSLFSYLQSLNKSVGEVRYDGASALCKELSKEFVRFVEQGQNNNNSNRKSSANTVGLYIFDRRCDAITPLLQQWTYRAMLHELLTINRGQIDLSGVSGIEPDMQKIVLDPDIDTFYSENMNLNYGDVSANAQKLIQKFQKEKSQQQKIDSIADMKAFLERYPAFKQLQKSQTNNCFEHIF